MEIANALWNKEPLKVVLTLDENNTFEASTDTEDGNLLQYASFDLSNGNDSVNPLGISESNRVCFKILDKENKLNINTSDTVKNNGVGIKCSFFIKYDNENWTPYGTFYSLSWFNSFVDGANDLVAISAEDKLNRIGNMDTPKIRAVRNMNISSLISQVLDGIGIAPDKYYIDPLLSRELKFGIVTGKKVRDFFNNICQLLFARVYIDRDDIINFVPAFDAQSVYNVVNVSGDYAGSISLQNSNAVSYKKIKLNYKDPSGFNEEELAQDNIYIKDGEQTLDTISFTNKNMGITDVKIVADPKYYDDVLTIKGLSYTAYQSEISIDVVASALLGEQSTKEGLPGVPAKIYISGLKVYNTEKTKETDFNENGISNFEFNSEQLLEDNDAAELLETIKKHFIQIQKKTNIDGTPLTPKLFIGDVINLNIDDTYKYASLYRGTYKICNMNILFGENYSMSLTLLRLK